MAYSFLASEKHITLQAFSRGGARRLDGWGFTPPGVAPPADRDAIFVEETAAFLGVGGDLLCDAADAQRTQVVVDAVKRSVLESTVVPVS
jgi:hypothetical protein